ncbi:ARM repeat superfamily protein [Striga hermonthica]|uniref:ARM repeat superfamily protein n=1 Tax=Striga hermonthica TaxID=68872 RepID=A0A9N7R8D0_STRHE|nr:ARM repeat superfamily protein [Striga hermonthica]
MSEVAVSDVVIIPEPEMPNGSSINGNSTKPILQPPDENIDEKQKKLIAPETENSRGEAPTLEVEYIESENLKDVEDVENCVKTLAFELGSKDWVEVCEALNNVRRLSIYHKESIVAILGDVIALVLKSLKNPRSALCKTAIMTCADIFKAYNDDIIEFLDPLLVQLLLKASQDKKFVCEAAESALKSLTSSVSPLLLLPKLQPYIKNRNPRIRAKASVCISRSVQELGSEGIGEFGLDKLIQIGASQLSDQLPESRDAARSLLLELQCVYEVSHVHDPNVVSEEPAIASWEQFCQSKLSPLSAQAVLRVTSVAREGLVGS